MRIRAAVLVLLVTAACAGSRAATWNDKGLAAAERHDWTEASTDFAEAVKLDPDSARYHTNFGAALSRRGLLTQASDEFRAALRADPNYVEASRALETLAHATQQRQGDVAADAVADALHR